MGFTKLLPTSRAFRRIVDRPSPYTVAQQNLLPKFGPVKQAPAQAGPPADPAKAQPREVKQQAPKSTPTAPPARAGMIGKMKNVFKLRKKTMKSTTSIPPIASTAVVAKPEQAFPLGRWTLFKNPFNRPLKPKSPVAVRAVQGELLLELVKPVRNDLSDSDIEVVPLTRPAPTRAIVALASREPVVGEAGVNRISPQLFGAGKP